ncbi:MAG: ABC transporter permease [Bacteroidales bacterium]|uniref:ABC transporter permease n=1 Tax=Porphyromonas sp. TaxID=1924944 RepID=UPI002970AC8C|nr:ABC transporter permease [Porphyromonas sp.]MDD7437667.1 ABC transporter permease [Bacteroidales bacterium]MDY3066409.1 ABC transporter permease [Porphyromonas sp.]
MVQQYFKQAWRVLRENPVLSTITILGTALSIAMIMMLVMTDRVMHGNFAPENTRDRTLYVKSISVESKENGTNNSRLGLRTIKEVFLPLKTPEALYFYTGDRMGIRLPGGSTDVSMYVECTNGGNWRLFDYTFLAGRAFGEAEVKAADKVAVITDKAARQLFESDEVVGKSFILNGEEEFRVIGVVKQPSNLTNYANGSIWIPYTSTISLDVNDTSLTGSFQLVMLAKNKKDMAKIRAEVATAVEQFNTNDPNYALYFRGQPDTYKQSINRFSDIQDTQVKAYNRKQILLLLLFLLVPAINLSLMTTSRMKQRASEIGVRRTYGASTMNIANQVIWESLLYTVIGSMVGFVLSIGGFFMLRKILFKGYSVAGMQLSVSDLMRPEIFLSVIIFCLLLNLIASIVPAVRASRSNIINNLYEA